MPSENMEIIYCTQIDDSGRMVESCMLFPNRAREILENAEAMFAKRKEK